MSTDCFKAINPNPTDVVSLEAQVPCRLSTTSLEVIDIETSGNNGVLDLNSSNSGVSCSKISTSDKQKPESNYAVLKKYQSLHLQSEEPTLLKGTAPQINGNRNDSELESATSTSTQKARQYESQEICRFYQRNNFCKFGQNCRYLHEGGEVSYENYSSRCRDVEENEHLFVHRRSYNARPVCRYFEYYGYCDYGDRCKYQHSFVPQFDRPEQQRQTPVKKSKKNLKQKENQVTSSPAAAGYTDNSNLQNVIQSHVSDGDIDSPSPLGDFKLETEKPQPKKTTGRKSETENTQLQKTPGRKSEIEKPKAKRAVCRFLKQYGNCKYEDRCAYLHSLTVNSDLQTDVSVQEIGVVDLSSARSEMEKPLPKKTAGRKSEIEKPKAKRAVCRFLKQYGNCKYEDRCAYLHSLTVNSDLQSDDASVQEIGVVDLSSARSETEKPQLKKTTGRKSEIEKPKAKIHTICRFFKQYGSCKYEDRCAYLHSLTVNSDLQSEDMSVHEIDDVDIPPPLDDIKSETEKPQPKKTNRPRKRADCRFFKQYGNCKYGDRCRYLHETGPNNSTSKDNDDQEETTIERIPDAESNVLSDGQNSPHFERGEEIDVPSSPGKQAPTVEVLEEPLQVPIRPSLPKPLTAVTIHLLDQLSEEDLQALRKTEITQLKKRFPKCEVLQEENSGSEYVVEFLPSDADWPFEVKLLHLKVWFPSEYPLKPCFVEVVDVEDCFPETLVRYLDRSMQSWIEKRHEETAAANKVEIAFKPFLHWLDRNLENLFINGLRMVKKERDAEAAGIEFVPYEKLQSAANHECSEADHVPEMEMFDNQMDVAQDSAASNATPPSTESKVGSDGVSSSSLKRGTEVVLRNLALGENAATLVCRKIALTLQCGRCKTRNEIDSPANRSNKVFCSKCHHVQTLTYRPQLLHQFGSVLGYLDLAGCQVVDMPIVNCHFDINCLQCATNFPLNGLHYGQRNDNWCHNCNSKMTIFVESVKFHQLQPSTNQVSKGFLIRLEPKEKRVKDPAIQEGKPLPSDGTCKHFKKSYRWLRFPCCGKAYPCDVCHNEKETDHDMKYATRMICGFCAKEQPYSTEKPCVLCKSSMTKKSSTHWEGGKGCRDKTKMSRDDQHKYAGTSKTISRKVQEKTKPVAKK